MLRPVFCKSFDAFPGAAEPPIQTLRVLLILIRSLVEDLYKPFLQLRWFHLLSLCPYYQQDKIYQILM